MSVFGWSHQDVENSVIMIFKEFGTDTFDKFSSLTSSLPLINLEAHYNSLSALVSRYLLFTHLLLHFHFFRRFSSPTPGLLVLICSGTDKLKKQQQKKA